MLVSLIAFLVVMHWPPDLTKWVLIYLGGMFVGLVALTVMVSKYLPED